MNINNKLEKQLAQMLMMQQNNLPRKKSKDDDDSVVKKKINIMKDESKWLDNNLIRWKWKFRW